MFTRDALPAVGHVLTTLHGQDFTLSAISPANVLTWSGVCTDCGSPTTTTTPCSFAPRSLHKRCEPCMLADYGCTGAERAKLAQVRYGEAQRASHAVARDVKAGLIPLAVKRIAHADLTNKGLACLLTFNDRKRRPAVYRDGEVRCYAAKDCDYSALEPILAKLHAQALAASLF